ncbi:MAG: glycosyltransferase, partial [Ignavibacteriaceae bacterium]|nr:glycosyltransferase [Ignavibacteriaceae bacterium]
KIRDVILAMSASTDSNINKIRFHGLDYAPTADFELLKKAYDIAIEKNIELIGLLSRTEIFELMQRSMILVHPSTFEGFGYVFAEALINGMNIVSFNVGCTQNHLKWFIAKDEQDFINIAQDLLKTTLDFVPVNLFPLDETVESYASIYGIK